MKGTTIASLLLPPACVLLLLSARDSPGVQCSKMSDKIGEKIGDLILALPTDADTASERLDLFPTIRTLVRVMRMINRPAAMERVKSGLKKIVHR